MKRSSLRSLSINSFLYETALSGLSGLDAEGPELLDKVAQVCLLAWRHHPGRFADGAVENLVLRHGQGLGLRPSTERLSHASNRPTTVHVVSEINKVGGHSRVLLKWIDRDHSSRHVVVFTNQPSALPQAFLRLLQQRKADFITLSSKESLSERGGRLRTIGLQGTRIILHTHPHDPIPVVAFASREGPPVAMFNHAHFSFCLGATVSDVIVNTFPYFADISSKYRYARKNTLLPVTCGVKSFNAKEIDKTKAKAKLGFSSATPLVLTVGAETYFTPTAEYDFFRTASRLLDRDPTVSVIVVGVDPSSPLIPIALRQQPRFKCVGVVEDPAVYYHAADVFLESFPMPSLGALVEGVAYGEAFPVPVYGKGESILRVNQPPILTHDVRPDDENGYVAYIIELLLKRDEIRGRAREMRESIVAFEDRWSDRLIELNRAIDCLEHRPSEIPMSRMIDTTDTRSLAVLSPVSLPRELGRLLPPRRALVAKLRAASKGLLTFDDGVAVLKGLRRRVSGIRCLTSICS